MPPPSLSLKSKQVKVKNSNKCKNTNSMAIHERNRAKCFAFLNNWNAISLFNILCIENLSLNQKVSLTFWCQLLLRYCIALFYEKSTLPPWLLIKDANDVDWKYISTPYERLPQTRFQQKSFIGVPFPQLVRCQTEKREFSYKKMAGGVNQRYLSS